MKLNTGDRVELICGRNKGAKGIVTDVYGLGVDVTWDTPLYYNIDMLHPFLTKVSCEAPYNLKLLAKEI